MVFQTGWSAKRHGQQDPDQMEVHFKARIWEKNNLVTVLSFYFLVIYNIYIYKYIYYNLIITKEMESLDLGYVTMKFQPIELQNC